MTREEIYDKVKAVMVDALGVDEDEVKPESVIRDDLGAESIDFSGHHVSPGKNPSTSKSLAAR